MLLLDRLDSIEMDNNILILGIGGAGGNIINTILKNSKNSTLRSASYIYADTDGLALRIFKNNFGKNIDTFKLNSEECEFSSEVLCGVERLFIVVGLGGKTGSHFAGKILQKAKEMNILVSVFATIPFEFEYKRDFALEVSKQLTEISPNDVFIFDNEKLKKLPIRIDFINAFSIADNEAQKFIEGLV